MAIGFLFGSSSVIAAENPMASAQQGVSMKSEYGKTKARTDPKNKIPIEAGKLLARGFIFIKSGMFKDDVNRTAVDLDKKSIAFDYYRQGQNRLKGHIGLQPSQIEELIQLSNKVWNSSKDNAENGQLLHGFRWLLNLVLVDRGAYRVTGFTPRPLEEVGALYTKVSEMIDVQSQQQ